MLTCVLCKYNTMYWNNLCEDCTKIQKLMDIYGQTTIHEFIDKTLKIQEEKMEYRIKKNINDVLKKE